MGWSIGKRIGVATAIAGTLDISLAIIQTLRHGRTIDGMLRGVASGPFPGAREWGAGGAALGLGVHYALMAIMAVVYVAAADRLPMLKRAPLLWGPLYGLATFVVLDLGVISWRYGSPVVTATTEGLITQLFAHIVLVGVTFGLVARKG
jgi:hypothetical protein